MLGEELFVQQLRYSHANTVYEYPGFLSMKSCWAQVEQWLSALPEQCTASELSTAKRKLCFSRENPKVSEVSLVIVIRIHTWEWWTAEDVVQTCRCDDMIYSYTGPQRYECKSFL